MPQYFVPKKKLKGRVFEFDESESYHLSTVLRRKPGDFVQIFDGEGRILPARITEVSDPRRVRGEVLDEFPEGASVPRTLEQDGKVAIELYPAVLKGPRFEWLLEKAVELGAAAIRPVLTQRTLADFDEAGAAKKAERWRKIALAAAKQCERARVPAVDPAARLEQALRQADRSDVNLILWEREDSARLQGFVERLRASGAPQTRVRVFTGPEGGFAQEEIELARKFGVQPVLLSPTILRAETAALAALALISYGAGH